MKDVNNLVYFLNSIKNTLPFDDEKDFIKKINENKDFRIKVQKLVFLSKFFGWENPYIFTLAERGPYSVELMQLYSRNNLFDNLPVKIENFNLENFLDFIKNKTILSLEAISTILYLFDEDIGENTCVSSIHNLKSHISADIIRDAYICVKTFDLF